jgi:hypothetical protein
MYQAIRIIGSLVQDTFHAQWMENIRSRASLSSRE